MLSILIQFKSNLSQHLMVNGFQSKLINVVQGVPLASGLGQLVFLLYTRAFFHILEETYRLQALELCLLN